MTAELRQSARTWRPQVAAGGPDAAPSHHLAWQVDSPRRAKAPLCSPTPFMHCSADRFQGITGTRGVRARIKLQPCRRAVPSEATAQPVRCMRCPVQSNRPTRIPCSVYCPCASVWTRCDALVCHGLGMDWTQAPNVIAALVCRRVRQGVQVVENLSVRRCQSCLNQSLKPFMHSMMASSLTSMMKATSAMICSAKRKDPATLWTR